MYLITLKLKVGGCKLGPGLMVSEAGKQCMRAVGVLTVAGRGDPLYRILSVTNFFLTENT